MTKNSTTKVLKEKHLKNLFFCSIAYGEQNKCNLIVVSVFQYWLRKQSKPNDVMLQATLYHSFLLDFVKNVYPPFTRYIYISYTYLIIILCNSDFLCWIFSWRMASDRFQYI